MLKKKMNLKELKIVVENHLRKELDIFEQILKLSEEEAKDFHKWYLEHSVVKGIKEVLTAVRSVNGVKGNEQGKSQSYSNIRRESQESKEGDR